MPRQPRTPKASERLFTTMCSIAGILCHEATEDEMGWDFLIEFPPEIYSGPAESRPAGNRAYVQIKSTTQSAPRAKLKLSNARQSSQHNDPWFVILFHHAAHREPKIYAIHFWEDLIIKASKQLGKRTLTGTCSTESICR